MIRSFKSQETAAVFGRKFSKKLPQNIQRVAFRKLRMLHRAVTLDDLRVPPSNRIEALHGDLKGRYSIRINDQWRICFIWKDGEANEVEIIDYH
jgi:proteic killer suppression protein